MLLKVGLITTVLALALAAGVALALPRPEDPAPTALAVEPLAAETTRENEFDPGEKLRIDDEPAETAPERPPSEERKVGTPSVLVNGFHRDDEPTRKARRRPSSEEPKIETPPVPVNDSEIGDGPAEKVSQNPPSKRRKKEIETPPVQEAQGWPEPSRNGISAMTTNAAPRYYQPQHVDTTLSLTIGAAGLYDIPVTNSNSRQDLDRGVIHLPQTPFPWDERQQKNVYLAGHRAGYGGSGSPLIFFNLDKLKKGDPIVLEDGSGTPYEYEVSEVFVVTPNAGWALDPVRGRDMLTLQTCTYPAPRNRIIIRADRKA